MPIDKRLEDRAVGRQMLISIYDAQVVWRTTLCGVNRGIDQRTLGGHAESWGHKAVAKSTGLESCDLTFAVVAELVLFWVLLSVKPLQKELDYQTVSSHCYNA